MQQNKTIVIPAFTLEQIEKMISVAEADVAFGVKQLTDKEKPLEEARQFYETEKEEYNKIKQALESDKQMLATLNNLRNGRSNKSIGTENIRVLRQTSNLDKSPKKQRTSIKWKPIIAAALMNADKYVDYETLFAFIIKSFSEITKQDKNKLYPAVTDMVKKGMLVKYKDKFGLTEWSTEGKPTPSYVKDFMYVNGVKD